MKPQGSMGKTAKAPEGKQSTGSLYNEDPSTLAND